MITLWGSKESFCDGISRRNFLKIGAFGAGLTLADMLRLQAATKNGTKRPKAAIMVYLGGGPSHMDMYDLKPDAPKEFRGEFNPIPTSVPGCHISEYLPRQARIWDKLSAVRSIECASEHSDSQVMTGYPERISMGAGHPSFGAVISKLRNESIVPPFVSLRGNTRGTEPGYLGVAHRPFTPRGLGIQNLSLPAEMTADRMEDRRKLLGSFDSIRRDIDASGTMSGIDSFTTRALDMIANGIVRDALDLNKEEQRSRDRYKGPGLDSFLLARRLIEAGVGCVTLSFMSFGGFDTHNRNFERLKRQLPVLDQGIANLIEDLHNRGMQDDVVTIVWGEFGRTPKINDQAGRDHWPAAMSAMVAGGGLKMGQMVGSTTAKGERPKDSPYSVQNILSTLYRTMGIDPSMTFPNAAGRPMYLLDDRKPVEELL